ncbi:tubulin-like doman-containing protein [Bacteroides reticulotermitis]|uniref:Tubulin like n=2 Tax=Bacteroides reticulotermitis TaxID=1133319 RepID=W4UNP1_9BACE|nr:tubulin-like doman-containing protein [Bacteroides reticulotermitis]MBB4044944.1 hypothetical protein [Bacteroides reticulotermitis]GAE82795.1 hypothetical protein JCM10512_1025 [Bacteroides reticulotermitis JCM 10512]
MDIKENHILVGLGGTGGKILKAFRKRLYQEYNADDRAGLPVGYVYIDSTREMMQPNDVTFRVLGQDASFNESEFVFIKGVDLHSVFSNPSGFPGLKGFIGDPEVMQKTIGSVDAAAAQKRRAGRILFGSSVQSYINTLKGQYTKVKAISSTTSLNIHIFTGLAGGTGSGSIIDVIAQTRNEYRDANIVLYCMVPEHTPPGSSDAGRYHANGYAALLEINALMTKKYMPYDVTGINERVPLEHLKKVVDSCILYSNENENGLTVESHKQLPIIVSDFLYNRIFLTQNDTTEEFLRAYSLENIEDFRNENSEKVKEGVVDIVRSKAFSSFGIKRVVIPEEEIVEYFTYSFGRQALLQLRFNNWNDDMGFRDTPANIDFHSFVKEAEQLERWRLTDKHLTLDKPILESDQKKWNSFADYWGGVIPVWTEEASRQKIPLNELEKYCSEGYDKFFRKVGVKNFFEGKTQAKEEHANEICTLIEQYMFDKWCTGDLSLYNLCQLIDRIIESTDLRRKECEGNISSWNQTIEQLEKAKAMSQLDWSSKGFIGGLLSKNKLVQTHATIMQQMYIKKSEVEGLHFAVSMLGVLLNKLNGLRGRIERFVNVINEALDDADKQIGGRCQDQGAISNLQETIIRFYDNSAVQKFTKDVVKDKNRQKSISDEFRQELVKMIGSDQTFARANAAISTDNITTLLDTIVRRKSIIIHDEILIENNEKLINRNILEQLNEQYRSDDDLRAFAKKIIEQSGVFLTFSPTENNRAIKNNPIPQPGLNIDRKIVLINLPKAEGNEQIQKFAGKLKDALINAVTGGVQVKVDMNGVLKNEMTIACITYCFPIRVLKELPFMKEKYDYLVTNPNEARQNRTVLHTEGTGESFPSLFVANDILPSELRKIYTPYLILAYALGIIKYADKQDGTGLSAYGTVEEDALGLEVLEPMADKFIDIPFCDKFKEEFGEDLKAKFATALKADYLHVEKRKMLVTEIQGLIKNVILPECGNNQGTEQFLFFKDAALQAIELVK